MRHSMICVGFFVLMGVALVLFENKLLDIAFSSVPFVPREASLSQKIDL